MGRGLDPSSWSTAQSRSRSKLVDMATKLNLSIRLRVKNGFVNLWVSLGDHWTDGRFDSEQAERAFIHFKLYV